MQTRRQVLIATAVSLPMLQTALGNLRQAAAAMPGGPGAGPGGPGGAGGRGGPPPEKPGWLDTKIVAMDLKDKEFTAVPNHRIILTRSDKSINAITNVCTHKGCLINPATGKDILACRCHGAQFHLDGTVAKGPANKPLDHFAVRLTPAGTIEVDPGQVVAKDAKEATATLA